MAAGISFPFEKLRGRENFDIWKRHAKSYLVLKNCWKIVEDGLAASPSVADKDTNERALAELTLMIEPTNFAHIATSTTAKAAWEALLGAFEDKGLTRKVDLLKQLVQLKLTDFDSMEEYINKMVITSLKVKDTGLNIDDELVASLMLAGLPEEFRSLVLAVENSKSKLNMDMVKNLLLQDIKFDNHIKLEENAFVSKKEYMKKKKFKCHGCKKEGHFIKNCPNKCLNSNGSRKQGKSQTREFCWPHCLRQATSAQMSGSSIRVQQHTCRNQKQYFTTLRKEKEKK